MTRSLIEQQFGPSARAYAECEVHAAGASLGELVNRVRPASSWRALDIATGAGHTALAFAPHVSEVIASDLTSEMLSETQRLAAERSLDNVSVIRCAADTTPFDNDGFDLVTCRLAAHHFPSIDAFIGEAARILKPGGRLAVVDNVPPTADLLPRGHTATQSNEALAAAYNAFEIKRDPSHAKALSVAEWEQLLLNHGFVAEPTEVLIKEMAFTPWVTRMNCTPGTIEALRRELLRPGDLKAFFMPREHDGDIWFSLREAIFVARRRA